MEWLWKGNFLPCRRRLLREENYSGESFSFDINERIEDASEKHHQACLLASAEILKIEKCTTSDIEEYLKKHELNKDWFLVMWTRNENQQYTGLAIYVKSIHSFLIAHFVSCPEENILVEFNKILDNNFSCRLVNLAASFVHHVKEYVTSKTPNTKVNFIITGHHLGGWLAQVSYFAGKYMNITDHIFKKNDDSHSSFNFSCISFDPPGCREFVCGLKMEYDIQGDSDPVSVYLTNPNLINTLGPHWGTVCRMFPVPTKNISVNHPLIITHNHPPQSNLRCSISDMKDICGCLKKDNGILLVQQWPTVSILDYRYLNSTFFEKLDIGLYTFESKVRDIEETIEFEVDGIIKRYKVVDTHSVSLDSTISTSADVMLENMYVQYSNTRYFPLSKFIDTKQITSDCVLQRIKQSAYKGESFVLRFLPKQINIHYKTYYICYYRESLIEMMSDLITKDVEFSVCECYKSKMLNEVSSIAVLSSFSMEVVLMISGVDGDYFDRQLKESFNLANFERVIRDIEHGNRFLPTLTERELKIFEYLCQKYSSRKVLWLQVKRDIFILKSYYDPTLRIKRQVLQSNVENSNTTLNILLNKYDAIFLYGKAGCGKTNEISNIIFEIKSWAIYIRIVSLTVDDFYKINQAVREKNEANKKKLMANIFKIFLTFDKDDEELIESMLEESQNKSPFSKKMHSRLLICFDGMDLLVNCKISNGQLHPRQIIVSLLQYLKSTNIQILITARRRDKYLQTIEKNITKNKWSGELKELDEEEMKRSYYADYLFYKYSMHFDKKCDTVLADDAYDKTKTYMSKSLDIIGTPLLADVATTFLNNSNKEDSSINIYSLFITKKIRDVLFLNKCEYNICTDKMFFQIISKSLKKNIFRTLTLNKYKCTEKVEEKKERNEVEIEMETLVTKFWDSNCDLTLELISADYLYRKLNKIIQPIGDLTSRHPFWTDIMTQDESYCIRSGFNEIVKGKKSIQMKNIKELREITVFNNCLSVLLEEEQTNILEFFSELFLSEESDAMHIAARQGTLESVEKLIDFDSKLVTMTSKEGYTPLHEAAMNGHAKITALLLVNGAKTNDIDTNGCTALHLAVGNEKEKRKEKMLHVVKEILQTRSADVNLKNKLGDTALNLACKNGALDIVECLVKESADIELANCKNFTPFLTAVCFGHLNITEFLINKRCNIKPEKGISAIHSAAVGNFDEIIRCLAKSDKGVITCVAGERKYTALHLAARNGSFKAVKCLIELGADINAIDENGETPLHLAAKNDRLSVVEYLIDLPQTDLYTHNVNGLTPVHSAANSLHFGIVECFLNKKDYDVNVTTELKETLLSFRIRQQLKFPSWLDILLIEKTNSNDSKNVDGYKNIHFAAYHGDVSMIENLNTNAKTDLNSRSLKGYTPIYIAVAEKSDAEMEKLIELGADVDIDDEERLTPFHLACAYGKYKLVDFLATRKPSIVNKKTKNGYTALHLAVYHGHKDVVSLLVFKYKADLYSEDKRKYTPLHVAAYFGRLEIVQFLVDRTKENIFLNLQTEAGSTALNVASQQGKIGTVKYLVDSGVDTSLPDKEGFKPIHSAAYRGHENIVSYFVKEKQLFNDINSTTKKGSTPLFLAVKNNKTKVSEFLLNNNANVDICNNAHRFTLLHLAAFKGNTDILPTLIHKYKYKGKIDVKDDIGRTPLYLAAMKGNTKSVNLLIEADANIFIGQIRGWLPLHIAVFNSHLDVVKLMVKKKGIECINSRTQFGDVALHLAAWNGNVEIIEYLIEQSNNGGIENELKITPLDLAVSRGHAHAKQCPPSEDREECQKCRLYEYFVENNHNLSYLNDINNIDKIEYELIRRQDMKAVEYLTTDLKGNFHVLNTAGNQWTPIHAAAYFESIDILDYLVNRGWDINVIIPELKETPLYVAVVENKEASVKYLVEKGADLKIGDHNGWTPLHAAVYQNHADIVEYLCQQASDILNAGTDFDMTPLYVAVEYMKFESVEILMKYNADPTKADKNSWNPLKVAEYNLEQCKENPEGKQKFVDLCFRIREYTEKWYSSKRKRDIAKRRVSVF